MGKKSLFKRGAKLMILFVFVFSGAIGVLTPGTKAIAPPKDWQPRKLQELKWGSCTDSVEELPENGMQCATLKVPLDYRKPNGRKISVAVSRVKASNPGLKRGSLFLNPGGPGGSGLGLPQIFAQIMPEEVVEQYDLIGFDPRGVGQSTPVSCGLTASEALQAFVPLTQDNSFEATSAYMQQVSQRCSQTSGDLLPYITTANTARDMDAIRAALGESKISYLGYSYGTHLGAVYSSMYSNRTDRFVLDSSTGPDWAWRDQFRAWRLAEKDRYPDLAKYITANNATLNLGATEDEVNATYTKLMARLDATPLDLGDGTFFNDELFRQVTFGSLYGDVYFPQAAYIWQYINELPEGGSILDVKKSIESLTTQYSTMVDVPADNSAASGLAVLCGDAQWSRDTEQYKTELATDTLLSPKFGELGSNIWPCAFWQNDPKEPSPAITSNGARNILIVQNLRDPATPYQGAQEMRTKLGKRAQMVSVDGGGHGVAYIHPNKCATDTTSQFLASGALPKSDKLCSAEPDLESQSMASPYSAKSTKSNKDKAREILRKMVR